MHFGMLTPNFGEFGEARALAELAREAEEHGWDGIFLWDHIQFPGFEPCADPWVALGAMAMADISDPFCVPLGKSITLTDASVHISPALNVFHTSLPPSHNCCGLF